jgi:hypothetical protein
MKNILALSILLTGLNSFAQEPQAMMNCSSADQKLSIQLTVNFQGKLKSLVVNNVGKLTAVSRDQLITFSNENIVFETDTQDVAVLILNNQFLSFSPRVSASANITVGIFGLAQNAYQIDMNKMTPVVCKSEVK